MNRARMVQAVAAGESITEIARKEELSRAWVTRELDSGECRHLLTELMNNERAQVYNLFGTGVELSGGGVAVRPVYFLYFDARASWRLSLDLKVTA